MSKYIGTTKKRQARQNKNEPTNEEMAQSNIDQYLVDHHCIVVNEQTVHPVQCKKL
jgi:hypothetical protein